MATSGYKPEVATEKYASVYLKSAHGLQVLVLKSYSVKNAK